METVEPVGRGIFEAKGSSAEDFSSKTGGGERSISAAGIESRLRAVAFAVPEVILPFLTGGTDIWTFGVGTRDSLGRFLDGAASEAVSSEGRRRV
jgi:hypothetical protein